MVDNTSKGSLVPNTGKASHIFQDIKYNCSPGGSSTVGDPHAYFSRPGSSQSMYGGRGGPTTDRERKQDEEFRAKLAAMQADDDSPPSGRRLGVPSQGIVCR